MPDIRFLRNYLVKDDTGTSYAAGDVVKCSVDSAEHFIRRKAAELVKDKPKTAPPKPKAKTDGKPTQPDAR